jgi:hypothetical protein
MGDIREIPTMIERKVFCDRCGDVILEQGSVMGAKAGEVVQRYPEPLDLCLGCLERFGDWLKGGRQTVQAGPASDPMKLQTK